MMIVATADSAHHPVHVPKKAKAHQREKTKTKAGAVTISALDRVTPYQPVVSAEGRATTGLRTVENPTPAGHTR